MVVVEENHVFPLAKINTMTSVNANTCGHVNTGVKVMGGHRRVNNSAWQ